MAARHCEITALYLAEGDRLERQVRGIVGAASARDIVHEVFLRICERATAWNGEAGRYLNRSARNAAIDHLRAERRRAALLAGLLPEQQAPPAAAAADIVAARQQLERIEAALAALPDRTRHIFLLNRVHGRSFTEIARAVGISDRAVARHMARAVAACHQAIAP